MSILSRLKMCATCYYNRLFDKMAEIGKNGNIGIIGYGTSKQKIQQQNIKELKFFAVLKGVLQKGRSHS